MRERAVRKIAPPFQIGLDRFRLCPEAALVSSNQGLSQTQTLPAGADTMIRSARPERPYF